MLRLATFVASSLLAMALVVACGDDPTPEPRDAKGEPRDAEAEPHETGGGQNDMPTDPLYTPDLRDSGLDGPPCIDNGRPDSGDYPFRCHYGAAGGHCSDVAEAPQCVAGHWQCQAYQARRDQCVCFGQAPPGCECRPPTGFVCGLDAGPDADVATDGSDSDVGDAPASF